ncbi:MAG TPA: hypothetical protein VK996_15430 [Ramlibacter sp.]|nr:hypothetical protein [Ramlibacter sp.]
MKWLDAWITRGIRRAMVIGRGVALLGGASVLLGVFVIVLRRLLDVTVVFPLLAFFWLPESIPGFALGVAVTAAGLFLLIRAANTFPHHDYGPELPSVTQVLEPRYMTKARSDGPRAAPARRATARRPGRGT